MLAASVHLDPHNFFLFKFGADGSETVTSTEDVPGRMLSRMSMVCLLPETPVSLNTSLTEAGAPRYGLRVCISLRTGQRILWYLPIPGRHMEWDPFCAIVYFC